MVDEVVRCRLPRVASCRLRLSRAGCDLLPPPQWLGASCSCSESDEREAVSTLIW